jgi:GT2 family glycosyltransferase
MKPKVYIITLNYKNWYDTIECLESVLRNDYPNYQVIVIDNNSPNNSMEYLKAWAEGKIDIWVNPRNPLRKLSFPPVPKPIPYVYYTREEAEKGGNPDLEKRLESEVPEGITTKYPIVLIQSGDNLGFSGGHNLGIKYALAKNDFKYIWILNNDTVVEKEALSEMVKTFKEKDGKIGIVGSKLIRYYNPEKLQALCGTKRINWKTGNYGEYICPDCDSLITDKEPFEIMGYVIGASMLIKKELIKDIGFFDAAYFMWAEEADFCFRALKNGWKLYCCPTSVIYHKEGGSSEEGNIKKFLWFVKRRPSFHRFIITGYLTNRNGIYFVKKHFGYRGLVKFFLGKFLKIQIKSIVAILLLDDNKFARIRILLKGIKDGFLGRMGKPDGL